MTCFATGSGVEAMKKRSRFEVSVLALAAAFGVFAGGYFLADSRTSQTWTVETQRQEDLSADPPPASSPEDERPDSLLEGEVINVNTASLADLDRLPGIGEARAQAIVDWREENGPFQSVEDLLEVKGIGEGILSGLREYVTVD